MPVLHKNWATCAEVVCMSACCVWLLSKFVSHRLCIAAACLATWPHFMQANAGCLSGTLRWLYRALHFRHM